MTLFEQIVDRSGLIVDLEGSISISLTFAVAGISVGDPTLVRTDRDHPGQIADLTRHISRAAVKVLASAETFPFCTPPLLLKISILSVP